MANRFPLIIDTQDGNKIKELPNGDNLNLEGSSILNVEDILSTGVIDAAAIRIAGEELQSQSILDLNDTPTSFEGFANTILKVKNDESGIDFFSFEDFGDLTLGNIMLTGNLLPEFDNSGSIGSEDFRISEIWATELRGNLKSLSGEIVFDANTGLINYAAIFNAPTDLSQFNNDENFIKDTDLAVLTQNLIDENEVVITSVKGSVFAEDSTLLVDAENQNIVARNMFTDIVQLNFSSLEPNLSEGAIALADGIGWNPLSNNEQSLVVYLNGQWRSIAEGIAQSVPTSLTDLGITDGTEGQVLTTDGDGNFSFTTVSSPLTISNLTELEDVDTAGLSVNQIYLQSVTRLNVTNSGASAYLFDQYPGNNPTLRAVSGTTIAFDLNVTGHPFLIQDNTGTNFDTGLVHVSNNGTVTTGSAAQGKETGTLYWKIPNNISGSYQYRCSIHGVMFGPFEIADSRVLFDQTTRDSLSESTGSIADEATANVNITGYKGYMLYKIQTSAAAWVRLYVSDTARTADASRTQGQDPLPGSGVIAEVITTAAETVIIAPGVIGFNDESPVTDIIPAAVTNLSGGAADVTVTLTAVEMEV